jgi:hypothetical protein
MWFFGAERIAAARLGDRLRPMTLVAAGGLSSLASGVVLVVVFWCWVYFVSGDAHPGRTWLLRFAHVIVSSGLVGLFAMPPLALLSVAAFQTDGRWGSLCAGTRPASCALAMLGAGLLVPWWFGASPPTLALIVMSMMLAAIPLGIHSLVVVRRLASIDELFRDARLVADAPNGPVVDLGFGDGYRTVFRAEAHSYRLRARTVAVISCRGELAPARRAVLRIAVSSVAVALLGCAQLVALWVSHGG